MKNNFVVWVATKCYVVVIALYIFLAASGAAIAKPSTVEAPSNPPRHEWAEVLNGGLQSSEAGTEKEIDVLRPHGNIGIEGAKLCKNGSTESNACVSATGFEVIAPDKVSANSGREQKSSYSSEVIDDQTYQLLQGFILGVLIAWPIIV